MKIKISHILALLQLDNKIEIEGDTLISTSKKHKLTLKLNYEKIELDSNFKNYKTIIFDKDDISSLKEICENDLNYEVSLTQLGEGRISINDNFWVVHVKLIDTEWKPLSEAELNMTCFNIMRNISKCLNKVILINKTKQYIFEKDGNLDITLTNEWKK